MLRTLGGSVRWVLAAGSWWPAHAFLVMGPCRMILVGGGGVVSTVDDDDAAAAMNRTFFLR